MIELVFATHNLHKLKEVQAVIGDRFLIKSLTDIGFYEEIPETGNTFRENAKQKTDYLIDRYYTSCFGDDSGLEIDALNKEPGVYSARYSGSRDMGQNIALLLENMKSVVDRRARFRTIISLRFQGKQFFFEGVIEGEITAELRGNEGFGYDPIFTPDGFDKTFAEMTVDAKNIISHRAIATRKLAHFLQNSAV